MEYLPGDLADRYTILVLKKLRLPQNYDVLSEHAMFQKARRALMAFPGYSALEEQILEINRRIWDLEADIRTMACDEPSPTTLQEIGRRALKIRDLNRKRVETRNTINQIFAAPKEVKVDHASEEACQPAGKG